MGEYRFGFNGQMKDNEIYGEGNLYTAQFWEYDARIGRRWNLDPKPDASISMYTCFANNPILYSDPLGDTLVLGGDKSFALNDLYSIVQDKHKSLITLADNGTVLININNLKESEIKNDAGLELLINMSTDKLKYLYEVKPTGNDESPLPTCNNLSIEPRMEYHTNGDDVKAGFQGQVIIHPNLVAETDYYDENGKIQIYSEPRGSTVFHELAENWERTHNKLKYVYTKKDKDGKIVKDEKKLEYMICQSINQ